jgi:transketolase
MRKTFLKKVSEMIRNEPDTIFFTVDIGMWAIQDILEDFPDRAMNIGIYEDGLFSVAAGMALRGLVPTIFGIQPFLIERTLEQIKLDFAYHKVGVNVVGTGASFDYSKYGYSHYCAEDIGIVKMIPGVEFVAPGTAKQFGQLFEQSYRNRNPTFFRISDHPNKHECDVEFGKANIIKRGKKATVIAVSVMLDAVLEACAEEDVTILYYTTLEPFDSKTLAVNCPTGKVLVCEPHFAGSLLTDIHTAFPNRALQIANVGLPREIFRNYGTYEEKMNHYCLTSESIRRKLQELAE